MESQANPAITWDELMKIRFEETSNGIFTVSPEDQQHAPLLTEFRAICRANDSQLLRAFVERLGGEWIDAPPLEP